MRSMNHMHRGVFFFLEISCRHRITNTVSSVKCKPNCFSDRATSRSQQSLRRPAIHFRNTRRRSLDSYRNPS